MTEERLKELVPDVEEYRTGINEILHCDVQPVREQTDKLRKAVKHLIQCNKYLKKVDGHNSLSIEKLIEQITGINYSELKSGEVLKMHIPVCGSCKNIKIHTPFMNTGEYTCWFQKREWENFSNATKACKHYNPIYSLPEPEETNE